MIHISENKKRTALEAIRDKCLDCVNQQPKEVRQCPCTDCPLYEFRLKKPLNKRNRVITEEQRRAASERMKKAIHNK